MSYTKTKSEFIKLNDFFGIFQHSYKLLRTNFLDQHDIKMTLHKHV
jgi:hypothetical protein